MATPKWKAGNPYPTGSLVQPLTAIAPVLTSLDNPGFDDGTTTGWTFSGGGTQAVTGLNSQSGTYNLGIDGGVVIGQNNENPAANPGLTITAQIYVRLSQSGLSAGRVRLWWLDAGAAVIGSPVDGNLVQKPGSRSERWVLSSLSAVAPALTASVKIGFWAEAGVGAGDVRVDSLSWNYTSASAPAGLIYKAVQPALGISDGVEPVWPLTPGVQVIDNTVIWEAMIANRVVWEASPIMMSGATEPVWPEVVGESITDNTVSWETVSLRVEDENCPNSKVVTIASSKVYAADGDIVRYSATVNPLDWTTPDDAGYLPTGLNQYGSNQCAVLNTYRGNVVPFSASTFQNWQVDPDPANITLLDSMEGIGSTYQQAAHPVANDLFYLAALGVRTVGIAAGTSNLAAGDAGMPIDPLVQAAMGDGNIRPMSTYYPSMGQYWLMMRPPLPVIAGPTITGEAPDGMVGDLYPGYQYIVTAGDSPIASVILNDGLWPTATPALEIDIDGLLSAGTATSAGTFYPDILVTDENGLTASLIDPIDILVPPPEWIYQADAYGAGLGGVANSPVGMAYGIVGVTDTLLIAGPVETGDTPTPGQRFYVSDDYGATFAETYVPASLTADVGMVVYGNDLWVAFAARSTYVFDGATFTYNAGSIPGGWAGGEWACGVWTGSFFIGSSNGTEGMFRHATGIGSGWTNIGANLPGGTSASTLLALQAINGAGPNPAHGMTVAMRSSGTADFVRSDDSAATWTATTFTTPTAGTKAYECSANDGERIVFLTTVNGPVNGVEFVYTDDYGVTFNSEFVPYSTMPPELDNPLRWSLLRMDGKWYGCVSQSASGILESALFQVNEALTEFTLEPYLNTPAPRSTASPHTIAAVTVGGDRAAFSWRKTVGSGPALFVYR